MNPPPVVVTWSMVFALAAMITFLLIVFFFLLRMLVRDAIELHTASVQTQVDRVVSLAESADGQYRALKRQVDEVERTAKKALDATTRLEGDIDTLKRRVGIPAT